MPIVYVHGVAVRSDPPYGAETEMYLREIVAPAVSPSDPAGVTILHASWHDLAARFAWNLACIPEERASVLGEPDEAAGPPVGRTPGSRMILAAQLQPELPPMPTAGGTLSGGPLDSATAGPAMRPRDLDDERLSNLLATVIETAMPAPASSADRARLTLAADRAARDPAVRARLTACPTPRDEIDVLVTGVQANLGGAAPGVLGGPFDVFDFDGLRDRLGEAVGRAATLPGHLLTRAAGPLLAGLNRQISLFTGDILTYLKNRGTPAEPGPIPRRVLDALVEAQAIKQARPDEPLVVMTHSMGGQIVYDLVSAFLPGAPDSRYDGLSIDFWCAAASQVAYFQEIKAFVGASEDDGFGAPPGRLTPFPDRRFLCNWWNVWDPNDYLSFTARGIFDDQVQDEAFHSELSGVQAHGGYLIRPPFFHRFAELLHEARAAGRWSAGGAGTAWAGTAWGRDDGDRDDGDRDGGGGGGWESGTGWAQANGGGHGGTLTGAPGPLAPSTTPDEAADTAPSPPRITRTARIRQPIGTLGGATSFPSDLLTGTGGPDLLPGTLGSVPAAGPSPTLEPDRAPEATQPVTTTIDTRIEDVESGANVPGPLQQGRWYALLFELTAEQRAGSLTQNMHLAVPFKEEEDVVVLTVQVDVDGADVSTNTQRLWLQRSGRSRNRARFELSPRHAGPLTVNATFLRDNHVIQIVKLPLEVVAADAASAPAVREPPAPPRATLLGRTIDSAREIRPRDVTLTILRSGDGYRLMLTGSVAAIATLPIASDLIDQRVEQIRKVLNGIVHLQDPDTLSFPYIEGLAIPTSIRQETLRRLAQVGASLFQDLFLAENAGRDLQEIGLALCDLARRRTLKVQISSEGLLLPWTLLYLTDQFDPNAVDPDLFLGLRHIVEVIPLQTHLQAIDGLEIPSEPHLSVALCFDEGIDRQMGLPHVAEQRAYWQQRATRPGVQIVERSTAAGLRQALVDDPASDHLLYFYCHGKAAPPDGDGGPDAAWLKLSDGEQITLGSLRLSGFRRRLPNSPLVFINACESAELSPIFYRGFAPYFVAKGARGVIGTECEVPALFAREWARRFFDAVLAGAPIGEAVLELRRTMFAEHNNILGLLYAVYCDGDTVVSPALAD